MRDRLLISMHIPKVAGTSFRKILEKTFGKSLLSEYGSKHPSYERFCQYDLSSASKLQEQGINCLHGHFRIRKYKDFDADFITWFRDPLAMIPSTYYYLKKNYPNHPRFPRKNCSLLEFINYDINKNIMSDHCDQFDINDFAAIGIVERFDESVQQICQIVDLKKPESKVVVNVNKDKSDLSQEEMEAIKRHNAQDIELYESAVKLHENRYGSN